MGEGNCRNWGLLSEKDLPFLLTVLNAGNNLCQNVVQYIRLSVTEYWISNLGNSFKNTMIYCKLFYRS